MSADRFDFEQQIQKCWMITDDIGEVSEAIFERNLSIDQIVNALTGLQQMYELKFNKLWDLFEDPIMDIVRENKMLNEECAAMRAQLQELMDIDGHGYGIAAIKPKKKDKK
jgi:hypothetical protein